MHSVFMCRHAGICMVYVWYMYGMYRLNGTCMVTLSTPGSKFVFEQSTTGSCMAFMLQYFIIFIFTEFPHLE